MIAARRPRALLWGMALCLAALMLTACVTAPRPSANPPLQSWSVRRAALLRMAGHFTLAGRVAASNGRDGFSAGIRWQQQHDQSSMQLSGPLGFGAVRVEVHGEQLSFTDNNGATTQGVDAQMQLAKMLGFQPPLRSLRYWALGVDDPSLTAQSTLDAQQRLTQLRQDGWQIDYQEYAPAQQQWLPRRLTVTRAPLRLRLVINAWTP